MNIKAELKQLIKDALDFSDENINIEIEIPASKEHGNYSTNIAMKLAKTLKKSPIIIAEEIKSKINMQKINKIEIVSPGFINFFMKNDYLLENINVVLKENENYGKSNIGNKEKINIEYVSANPTGTLHLGHTRGAAYGDSLSNILKYAGYDVTREYYINDAGNQMDNMAKSIYERYKELCGLTAKMEENYYYGKEIIEVAKQIYDKEKDTYIDKDIKEFKKIGLEYFLNQLKADLKDARIEFDIYTSEQSIRDKGLVEASINNLIKLGYTYEKDDALYLKTTAFNDEKDRVIIKNDGSYTYFAPDIAYHLDKLNRGYDKLIDVLGADHHGYIPRLKAAVSMLGKDENKLSVEIVQMVRAIKDGKEYKISKRTGKAITMHDLLQDAGVDAVRYFFVSKSLDTQMDFNVDLALAKTNENPVYYIEYAHARICSILNSYNKTIDNNHKIKTITSDAAYNVLEKIYAFTEIVEKSAIKKEPHQIANYVYDLAASFHSYYGKEKIITDDDEKTLDRIMLAKAVKITIANALKLIGVEAPEKM